MDKTEMYGFLKRNLTKEEYDKVIMLSKTIQGFENDALYEPYEEGLDTDEEFDNETWFLNHVRNMASIYRNTEKLEVNKKTKEISLALQEIGEDLMDACRDETGRVNTILLLGALKHLEIAVTELIRNEEKGTE